jgi:steroid 5-alpha reductase family enzyme
MLCLFRFRFSQSEFSGGRKIPMLDLILIQVAVVTLYASLWFLVALKLRRNDVADIAWGAGFIILAIVGQLAMAAISKRGVLVLALVTIWGLRLSLHIGLRNQGKAEDPRYRKWREEWGGHATVRAYFQLFLLQGFLIVVILIPATYILAHPGSDLTWLDALGVVVWLAGFVFEAVGDFQLARFKNDPGNHGRVITSGLWKYTRHPNYFGEVALWWGVWLIACSVPGGMKTVFGPATITALILFVSGIPLLEKKYEGNIEFKEYQRRTSAFFPLPPKR